MTPAPTRADGDETLFHHLPAGYQPAVRTLSRVVVTGGAGFLGAHLCRTLLDHGVEVVCIDDLSSSAAAPNAALTTRTGFYFLRHDVCDPLPVNQIGTDFDTVFHLASPASPVDYLRRPIATLRTGACGTQTVLDFAERCAARLVMTSTSEVYGDPQQHPQQETYWGNVNPIGPRSVYDEAKRYAEALAFAYHREGRVDLGVARIFNTYGPGMRADDGRMVPTFCRQALDGRPITVSGRGSQTRSLCYVDDTIDALIALARTDACGPVNVGNPNELTVLEVAELIRELAGSRSPIEFIAAMDDDPQRRCPDITVAREQLAWKPHVGYRDGLGRTLDWFETSGGRRPACESSA
jgi:dTDP-glucose 4,6-dehydratase